jgi:predicted Zn-dependent protease with MMP-like domain
MVRISPDEFEKLVVDALDQIPEPFASQLENVDVVIEEEPSNEDLTLGDLAPGDTLFGLYQGVPQTERDGNYTFVMPDKVTIFRGPISRACGSPAEIRDEVTVTVVHELAHHFGISDERLEELGW